MQTAYNKSSWRMKMRNHIQCNLMFKYQGFSMRNHIQSSWRMQIAILMFKYQGFSMFDVTIFSATGSEIRYPLTKTDQPTTQVKLEDEDEKPNVNIYIYGMKYILQTTKQPMCKLYQLEATVQAFLVAFHQYYELDSAAYPVAIKCLPPQSNENQMYMLSQCQYALFPHGGSIPDMSILLESLVEPFFLLMTTRQYVLTIIAPTGSIHHSYRTAKTVEASPTELMTTSNMVLGIRPHYFIFKSPTIDHKHKLHHRHTSHDANVYQT